MQKVSKEMLLDNILEMRQQKTGDRVSIPLIQEARILLKKYDYELPTISNQKANKYLKDAFITLKLHRSVMQSSHKKNNFQDTYHPLSEVISFHDARKTFITIALSKGIDSTIVMKLSGHRQYSVFKKYVDLNDNLAKIEIDKISRIK